MREHWLQHAHGRIVAGDSEPDVLADYGWVRLTDDEREAIEIAIQWLEPDSQIADEFRSLLERLPA